MTSTQTRPALNGVDVPTLFATLDAVKAPAGDRAVPVPRPQRVDQRHPQPHAPSRASSARARRTPAAPSRSPTTRTTRRCWSATTTRPTAGGVPAARHRRLPDVRPRQHRRRSRRQLHRVVLHRRGRHRPAGHPGLSDEVRNGYRQIRVSFDIEGDATPEELAALVEQSRRRSAVYDVLVNGTDVVIDVTTPRPTDPTEPPSATYRHRSTNP